MHRLWLAALACGTLAFLPSCGDTIHGKAIAEGQVTVFHQQLNAGHFEEIYAKASPDFQGSVTKEKILALFAAVERKLGKAQSSVLANWSVKTFNLRTSVVLVETTQFEHGEGTETFTYEVSGQDATLLGYYINSLDMMTK